MKPLERIFFMACVNEQIRVYDLSKREFSVRDIVNIFTRLGFSYKQLMYYVEKWSNRGFYEYGVSLDLGWFCFDELQGEYKEIYKNIHTADGWREKEFMQYIVKASSRGRITNYALKQYLNIGDDKEFYN